MKIRTILPVCSLLAACGGVAPSSSPEPDAGPITIGPVIVSVENSGGYVDLIGDAAIQLLDGGSIAACADLALVPVAVDASGALTPAGDPIIIHADPSLPLSGGDSYGCIDAFAGNDWGYQITASHFTACESDGGTGAPIQFVADTVAFNVLMDCISGQDVALSVNAVAEEAP